jgi:signal transduction histidine kinase
LSFTSYNLVELYQASDWRTHTYQVLGELGLLQSSLTDVETGVRGYALTGQESFLEPYSRALPTVGKVLQSLRTLTLDNASQQRRLDALEPMVKTTVEFLRSVAASGQSAGVLESSRQMTTVEGKRLMDQVRGVIADMVAEEQRLLKIREARESFQLRVTTPLLLGCGTLALALVGVAVYFLNRQIGLRRQAQEALQQAHDQLNQRAVGLDAANRQLSEQMVAQERATAAQLRKLNAELEQRVRERTAQLEAANKELEAFSYSVSHDLRAPLRAIDGFSRIVLEEYAPELNEDVKRYLQDVRANTVQMGRLVDDLLSFSRLSRQSVKKQPVASLEVVRRCLEDLRPAQEGRHIEFRLGALPSCEADPALLKQVWTNLLSNALKYTAKRDPAVIEVGCHDLGDGSGRQAYFIKDNGVGFDMRYAHKLFGVFQRLHRSEDYEGTGVGLAIVERIINRHGGTAWAEGKPDQGATFSFTLEPEASQHD